MVSVPHVFLCPFMGQALRPRAHYRGQEIGSQPAKLVRWDNETIRNTGINDGVYHAAPAAITRGVPLGNVRFLCENPKAAEASFIRGRQPLYVRLEATCLRAVQAGREGQHAARFVHARKGRATAGDVFTEPTGDVRGDPGVEVVVGTFQDVDEPGR